MKSGDAKQSLDDFLTFAIEPLGLSRSAQLTYRQALNEAIATVAFSFRWDSRGFAAFSCGVGVRFDCVAQWLEDGASSDNPTLGTPIHLLREDTRFSEWTFASSADLERLRQPILADVTSHALPFIQEYSHFANVVRTVASSNPKHWFNWNVDSRFELLAVARLVQGDRNGAIKILDDVLAEPKDALRKNRFDIEWLRKRILERG